MTDGQGRQRKTRAIGIVAVLVLISAVWGGIAVRNQRLAALRSKAKPGEALAAIKPPAGTKVLMSVSPEQPDAPFAVASYLIDSDCEAVKVHYRTELARHGFAPKALNVEPPALGFCGLHYHAVLGCKAEERTSEHEQPYMILLKWTDDAC